MLKKYLLLLTKIHFAVKQMYCFILYQMPNRISICNSQSRPPEPGKDMYGVKMFSGQTWHRQWSSLKISIEMVKSNFSTTPNANINIQSTSYFTCRGGVKIHSAFGLEKKFYTLLIPTLLTLLGSYGTFVPSLRKSKKVPYSGRAKRNVITHYYIYSGSISPHGWFIMP